VPYDVPGRVAVLQARHAAAKAGTTGEASEAGQPGTGPAAERPATEPATTGEAATTQQLIRESDVVTAHSASAQSGNGATPTVPGVAAIASVTSGKVTVEGKVRVMEIRPVERNSVLAVEINDSTGDLTAMFYGRSHIPGMICGSRVRFSGAARIRGGQPVMINPAYELISPGQQD
ncbi:MAG: OB-fold nucleic acid binding domain-containing protein, partial [Trebonia sp.]